MVHLHLCNRAGIRDSAAKSGQLGHNRDIGPNSGTVPAKPGHLATMIVLEFEDRLVAMACMYIYTIVVMSSHTNAGEYRIALKFRGT